jgi:hypothetical protein
MSENIVMQESGHEFLIPVRDFRTGIRGRRKETSPERRTYLREYYRKNRERAREYQRQYTLNHRRKSPASCGGPGGTRRRETVKRIYNAGDIMRATTEQSIRMIDQILRGERHFTM